MWDRRAALAVLLVLVPGCAERAPEQVRSHVPPAPAPATATPPASGPVDFQVVPSQITAGESAMLKWRAPESTRVLIQEGTESRPGLPIEWRDVVRATGSGEYRVTPVRNTWYVMTCEGGETPYCISATVHVVTRAAPK